MDDIANVKARIAKLLALADSPYEHEAQAALLKAREIMAKYKLRPEDATLKQNEKVIKRPIGVTCTKMTNTWAVNLANIIAAHYCCKSYRVRAYGGRKTEIGLVGLEDDFEICRNIYRYAYDCVDTRCKRIRVLLKHKCSASETREMANAYGYGFCKGLQAAYRAQDQEHQEYGLVLTVPQAVHDTMAKMNPPSVYVKSKISPEHRFFEREGYEAGQKFNPSTILNAGEQNQPLLGPQAEQRS